LTVKSQGVDLTSAVCRLVVMHARLCLWLRVQAFRV